MSKDRIPLRLTTLALIAALAAFPGQAIADETAPSTGLRCASWQPLAPEQAATYAGSGTFATCFRMQVDEVGALASHTWEADLGGAPAELLLLAGSSRDGSASVSVLHEAPGAAVLYVTSPGTLRWAVRSGDARQGLERFQLRSRFTARPHQATGHQIWWQDAPDSCTTPGLPSWSPEALASTAVWENGGSVEPEDCDVISGSVTTPGVVVVGGEGPAMSAELFRGDGCTADGRIAEGLLLGEQSKVMATLRAGDYRLALDNLEKRSADYDLTVEFYDLCSPSAGRTARSLPLCATDLALGDSDRGLLSDRGVDAEHFYQLELAKLARVGIEVASDAPLSCTLIDQDGRRVGRSVACGAGSKALVKTLPAGSYQLRIGGNGGSTGAYAVRWQSR